MPHYIIALSEIISKIQGSFEKGCHKNLAKDWRSRKHIASNSNRIVRKPLFRIFCVSSLWTTGDRSRFGTMFSRGYKCNHNHSAAGTGTFHTNQRRSGQGKRDSYSKKKLPNNLDNLHCSHHIVSHIVGIHDFLVTL